MTILACLLLFQRLYSPANCPMRPPTDARSVAGRVLNVLFQVVGTQFEPHTRRLFTRKTSFLFHLSNDPTTNTDQTNAESRQKETVNVFKVKSRLVWGSNWVPTTWKSTFGNWSCVSRGAQGTLADEGSSGIRSLPVHYGAASNYSEPFLSQLTVNLRVSFSVRCIQFLQFFLRFFRELSDSTNFSYRR